MIWTRDLLRVKTWDVELRSLYRLSKAEGSADRFKGPNPGDHRFAGSSDQYPNTQSRTAACLRPPGRTSECVLPLHAFPLL